MQQKSNRGSVIYIRTSTEQQRPEIQIRDIESLMPSHEATLLKEQLSAWKENIKRPQLEKLTKLVTSRAISEVYVWSLDRLYRNRKRLVQFLALCRTFDVKVFSYNQRWMDSIHQMQAPFNEIMLDLMLQILGWIGEEESTTKSNRVKMAVIRKASGTYSYKEKKWGRKAFPKQTINRVMELFNEGKSIRQIAALVQVYDKNNNGRPISKSAVHKIIGQKAQEKHSKTNCPEND